jgi:hypothetical protein
MLIKQQHVAVRIAHHEICGADALRVCIQFLPELKSKNPLNHAPCSGILYGPRWNNRGWFRERW